MLRRPVLRGFPGRRRRRVESELGGSRITDEERGGNGSARRAGSNSDKRVERTDARDHVETSQRHLCVT